VGIDPCFRDQRAIFLFVYSATLYKQRVSSKATNKTEVGRTLASS